MMADWKMDRWKFFDITHKNHPLCNPTGIEKLDFICGLMGLQPGAQVLDIACGKAELLVRLAERYRISGVGVDLSPYSIADAEAKRRQRAPRSKLQFLHMDGADYQPDEAESFDLAMCLGASWVFGGHRGTLRALRGFAKPGGLVMVGEPYWMQTPPLEYQDSEGFREEMFSTHYGNVVQGEEEGLTFLYSAVSSQDDWDRYEGLQYHAAAEYARLNPGDPDLPEIIRRVNKSRSAYLRWGRNTLGWALYLFRKLA